MDTKYSWVPTSKQALKNDRSFLVKSTGLTKTPWMSEPKTLIEVLELCPGLKVNGSPIKEFLNFSVLPRIRNNVNHKLDSEITFFVQMYKEAIQDYNEDIKVVTTEEAECIKLEKRVKASASHYEDLLRKEVVGTTYSDFHWAIAEKEIIARFNDTIYRLQTIDKAQQYDIPVRLTDIDTNQFYYKEYRWIAKRYGNSSEYKISETVDSVTGKTKTTREIVDGFGQLPYREMLTNLICFGTEFTPYDRPKEPYAKDEMLPDIYALCKRYMYVEVSKEEELYYLYMAEKLIQLIESNPEDKLLFTEGVSVGDLPRKSKYDFPICEDSNDEACRLAWYWEVFGDFNTKISLQDLPNLSDGYDEDDFLDDTNSEMDEDDED